MDPDNIDEDALLDEVEAIGGPEYRRLEERADGRDLMTWADLLAHETDVETAPDNLEEMAQTLVAARKGYLEDLAEEDPDAAAAFRDYWMEE